MTARDVINLHQGLTKSEIDCIINQSREGKNLRSNIVLASEEEMEVSDHSIADSILADYKSEDTMHSEAPPTPSVSPPEDGMDLLCEDGNSGGGEADEESEEEKLLPKRSRRKRKRIIIMESEDEEPSQELGKKEKTKKHQTEKPNLEGEEQAENKMKKKHQVEDQPPQGEDGNQREKKAKKKMKKKHHIEEEPPQGEDDNQGEKKAKKKKKHHVDESEREENQRGNKEKKKKKQHKEEEPNLQDEPPQSRGEENLGGKKEKKKKKHLVEEGERDENQEEKKEKKEKRHHSEKELNLEEETAQGAEEEMGGEKEKKKKKHHAEELKREENQGEKKTEKKKKKKHHVEKVAGDENKGEKKKKHQEARENQRKKNGGKEEENEVDEELLQEENSGGKSKTRGKKGKGLLPKHMDERFRQAKKKEEREMLVQALRQSYRDHRKQHPLFRSVVSDSDIASDDPEVINARASSCSDPDWEPGSSEEGSGEVFQPPLPAALQPTKTSAPTSNKEDTPSTSHAILPEDVPSTSYGTVDVSNKVSATSKEKKKKSSSTKKKVRKFVDPSVDDDPKEAPPLHPGEEQPDGWTKRLQRVPVHAFSGPNSGPTFGRLRRPVDYFLKFFPLALFTYIANMTNLNLQAKGLPLTSVEEIRAWIGIRIVMAICVLPAIEDYWSSNPGLNNKMVSKTMTRNRFYQLSSNFACSDPTKDPNKMANTTKEEKKAKFTYIRTHPMFHFQKLWDTVLANCRTQFNCGRCVAIDEAMVPYRGFKAWCQKFYMPCKPVRHGFKVYALADALTGYMANFIVHTPPLRSDDGRTYVQIAMEVASTHLDRFHHVFCDKLYTHLELANQLLQRNTYLTGAIKTNSKGLPPDMSKSQKNKANLKAIVEMNRTPRGTFYVRQKGPITFTLWKDSSILPLLSSAHNGFRGEGDQVLRRYTDDGDFTREPRPVKAPPAVVDYCKYMGGVDRSDQLRSYFSTNRKSQDWWKHMFFFLIDIARVNAYICYNHHHNGPTSNDDNDDEASGDESSSSTRRAHFSFTLAVAEQLIDGYSHGASARQPPPNQVPLHNFNGLHVLEHMGAKYAKICRQCRAENKTTERGYKVKTHFGCPTCGVHLCPTFCFPRYHARVNIQVDDGGIGNQL